MRCLYLLLLCLLTGTAHAQHDVILHNDGRETAARVLVITPTDISYLPATAPTDTLHVATTEVFMIRYANGTKEVLQHAATAAPIGLSSAEARQLGATEARRNFRSPGAFWGTFGATVAYAPAGLVVGGVIAASPPSPINIVASDKALLQNPDYVRGYRQQAKQKKLGKAAAGFGAGVGVVLLVAVALLAAVYH